MPLARSVLESSTPGRSPSVMSTSIEQERQCMPLVFKRTTAVLSAIRHLLRSSDGTWGALATAYPTRSRVTRYQVFADGVEQLADLIQCQPVRASSPRPETVRQCS